MKILLILALSCFTLPSQAQKYALLDKTMSLPVEFSNNITIKDEYKNFFAIERSRVKEFLAALDKIALQITKNKIPESFNFYVGNTRFYGFKVPLKKEERMDVVLTTDLGNHKISMHLCDGNVSNASNAFFIRTWAGYIRDNFKK